MKASNRLWKDHLGARVPLPLSDEIEKFEQQIALRKQGKLDEKVFAETRLRRGVYGQRYDNGQRHDGVATRKLNYPQGDLTKGPNTLWDAPGMQRIKITFGGLNASQLETLAELAEEYSDGIAHVTTRQDYQLHFVHLEDTPSVMRRLAAAGITTREACGNTVRNVTACPYAGVCRDECFDVTPAARAAAYFLLGHPATQNFGRKFKIAFSGCESSGCGLARMHDIGAIARVREESGRIKRGFQIYVGGGLGPVPHQAKLLEEFLPEEELLPVCQAIGRVFARLGEKKNRNTARLKFLVAKLGLEEFKRLVQEERAGLEPDDRWTEWIPRASDSAEEPLREPVLHRIEEARPDGFDQWRDSNVYAQRQAGFATVTVALPLGDISADQLRALADIARRYTRETVRTTVEQNIVLRWISRVDLPSLYMDLRNAGLASPGAGTISDIVACPGTDTCKLGISSSRGLAGELRRRIGDNVLAADEAIRGLHIKISGCFNSCGQHHVADIGFYGVSRNKGGYQVPHFQVLLGGQWTDNAGAYGLAIGAVPSKRIPETVERITGRYLRDRRAGESFQAFVKRIGKADCKAMLEDLMAVPPHDADPSLYTDWADAREYTTGDLGVGECAGEVVTELDFQLAACDREVFEAQLHLEKGDLARAAEVAYQSMLDGATTLLRRTSLAPPKSADQIVAGFRRDFYDTELFFDKFVGGNIANYFFQAHERRGWPYDAETARQLVEEAQLFLEAVHGCHMKLSAKPVA